MADASLQIGNGNWAVKTSLLLGYNIVSNRYNPIEIGVTRETTGSRTNQAGIIDYKDNNIARINYEGGVGSLLLEPQRTNLALQSEAFDDVAWTKNNAPTITTNIAVSPNGTTTADGIKADDGLNYKTISQTKTVSANSTLTFSIFVKKVVSETFYGGFNIYFTGGTAKICYGIVNAVNGTITIASSTITPITSVVSFGDYWRICCIATDNGSNTSVKIDYYATLSQNGTTLNTGTGSVRTIWGAQLEVGAYPTSYIPTTTSAVTRNQDSFVKTGISDLINSVEGVFFVETSALFNDTVNRRISLSDGTVNNRIIISYTATANTIRIINQVASTITYDFSYAIPNSLNFAKIAFKYQQNNFKVFVNGVLVNTSLTGITNSANVLNTLSSNDPTANPFLGNIKQLQLYKTPLTDAECIALTQ